MVLQLLGKDTFGGTVTPESFNSMLQYVNVQKMNDLIKVFEEKREISRDLYPFMVTLGSSTTPPITLDEYGYGEYPSDYFYTARGITSTYLNSCGTYTENQHMVQFLDQAEYAYRISSAIMYPTVDEPIAVDENDKFLVRPKGIPTVAFTYLRTPNQPYFDYDIISGRVVYLPPNETHVNSSVLPQGTPSESIEFEWPQAVVPDLINMIVSIYSISIRSEFNLQTSKTDQGQ